MPLPSPLRALLLVLALAAALAACGGGAPAPTSTSAAAPPPAAVPERLRVPASASELPRIALDDDPDLEVLTERVRGRLEELGFAVFDPELANATSPTRPFVRYLTFPEQLPGGLVHHVVFVAVEPWSPQQADRFIQTFFAMPANSPPSVGAPYFHFVSLHQPPFGVQYLVGNQWYGALESALLSAFADLGEDVVDVPRYRERATRILAEFGVGDPGAPSIAELDALLEALPRDPEGAYRPIATLLAIGVLFGSEFAEAEGDLVWTDDADALASWFALRLQGVEATYLRPIDFVLQAYGARTSGALDAYVELARLRLDEVRP